MAKTTPWREPAKGRAPFGTIRDDCPEPARTLIPLCVLMIRFLMPMGLAVQAAGTLGWSVALAGRDGAAVERFDPMMAMGALAAQALWAETLDVVMARGQV